MAKQVMEFADTVKIDRTATEVFDVISDLPVLFAKLRKKAPMEVERTVGAGPPASGDSWRISGKTRFGRQRGVVEVTDILAPETLSLHSTGRGFAVVTIITLSPQSPASCQLTAHNKLIAITFAARLLAPAIRLWRGRAKKALGKGLRRLKKRLER